MRKELKVVAFDELRRCMTCQEAEQIADDMNDVSVVIAFDGTDGTPCVCREIYDTVDA